MEFFHLVSLGTLWRGPVLRDNKLGHINIYKSRE